MYQLTLGSEAAALIEHFGFVPKRLSDAIGAEADLSGSGLTVFSSMFLHAGWIHIIGNLIYLRVFGDNVEDRMGHIPFLLFYAASGVAGVAGEYLIDPQSAVPMVGASGASE